VKTQQVIAQSLLLATQDISYPATISQHCILITLLFSWYCDTLVYLNIVYAM